MIRQNVVNIPSVINIFEYCKEEMDETCNYIFYREEYIGLPRVS